MSKQLIELFDLSDNSSENELTEAFPDAEEISESSLETLQKIENALPQITGLADAADRELDEIADMAINSYKDYQDLGMQVEPKFAAELFNSASSMLGHALQAKTTKINKKLKMLEAQLKKVALDQKIESRIKKLDNVPLGEGQAVDRNELLRAIIDAASNSKKTDPGDK